MRKLRRFTAIFAIIPILAAALGSLPKPASAAVSGWQKGATIFPRSSTDLSSQTFQQSVRNLKTTGANYVTLHTTLYQSNIYSTDIQNGWNTPTDQSLVDAINYVHSQGMKVMLKFQVIPYDGNWSAYINPGDRNGWFTNYGNFLTHYATIAKNTGAEEMCLGTELISMTSEQVNFTNTANWRSLIGKVRGIYSGALTYSANWGGDNFTNEKWQINFWDALDYLGISGYYNLTGDGSVPQLVQSWGNWANSDIAPFQAKWNKPVLFTEIGYKSITDSYTHPWMSGEGGGADTAAQARDYEALFEYWNNIPWMAGAHFWFWSSDPNAGGGGDNDYTPQNKPAQATMQSWFTQAPPPGGGGGGGGGGTPGGSFNSSGSANPNPPVVSQATTLSVALTDAGSAASGDIVDIEVYNSAAQKVFQKFFENQSFASGGSANYTASWTPGAADTYKVKVGVFNGSWTANYYWNDALLTLTVGASGGGGGGGGAPPPGAINIWWPTNGGTVSGVQPFKAMLTNASVDSYNMFWQVDGDALNPMATNMTDYPHKEALVDVSGWNWKGAGPYGLNFVAKDLSGNMLSQSGISINVAH